MSELEQKEEVWDLRKIFTLLLAVGLIAFGVKTFILDTNTKEINNVETQIEGVSAKETPIPEILPKQEIQKNVQNKIIELREEVNKINIVEIATSTPAVQKVLNDIKNLQNLPQSQAKQACFKICEGL